MSHLYNNTGALSHTVTYRETATLGDVLQSRITVSRDAGSNDLFELAFTTTFSQARNPTEPRVQHRLYVSAAELEKIIQVLNDALDHSKSMT